MATALHADTVLVVDDDPDSLRTVASMLEAAQITALVANSGRAGLDILSRTVPDLVVVDAIMPGLDGFETTLRIKQDPALSHVPVIFMTGLTESEHVIEAFEVGGVDYVRKPVNLDELLARVRLHMAHGRAVHASTASLDATGRMMMATDTSGELLWCTPKAERLIARTLPGWDRREANLPREIRSVVERLLSRPDTKGGSARVERPNCSLELAIIEHYRSNEVLIRLTELNPERDAQKLQQQLRLTQREAEVMLWISYGKSNSDISEVLSISPRTVQKHLERIYEKLGVETRSAAAAMAIKVMGQ
jgi:DNA-binding NarL/FixJ family response regulator